MKPLHLLLLCGGALACAGADLARAGEPGPELSPPAALVLAPLPVAQFADGTPDPWAAPPLPPIPAGFLWDDYCQQRQTCHGLSHTHGRGCGRSCGHPTPLLSLVSGVLDGVFSIFTFPARKAAAHHQGKALALRDCGCLPPLGDAPAWQPAFPALPPAPPPLPVPMPEADASPMPVAPPAVALPATPIPEPQRLYPGRAPVVELAPDPVLPDEGLPPRNRVPTPGDRLPKNVIPPR